MNRPLRAGIALGLLLPYLTGCYTWVPTGSVTPVGTSISVAVTDAGRIELADDIGPGIRRVAGLQQSSTDSTIVLALSNVEYIDVAVPVRMNGEQVQIRREYIADVRERKLSKGRSWAAAALAVAVAIVGATLAISGFGADPNDGKLPGDGGSQQ